MIGVGLLTFATLAVTAAIIKTEKIHNVLWWHWEIVKSIPRPQRRVGGEGLPAVLLDPVQVKHGVASVSSVLKYNEDLGLVGSHQFYSTSPLLL